MNKPLPPLSVYVHIPWCVRKCPYCDFNSHESQSLDETAYISALLKDLDSELEHVQQRPIQSIFIGGGTPSLFSAEAIGIILDNIEKRTSFDESIEITMEANPGTFEQDKFHGFRAAGVNRLSIGIQSFNDEHLKSLGRIHDSTEAGRAIDIALKAGFDNINIDLMYALPDQTLEQAVNDVQLACDSGVQHISHYQLTIEPNTYFHKHPPLQPVEDERWEIQNACQQLLAKNGYAQYEVSAYSKTGLNSRHNTNYWQFGDYLGIGAGAHGKVTSTDQLIQRHWKKRQPLDYMKHAMTGDALSGSSIIAGDELVFEFLLNALRLREGASVEVFEHNTALHRQQLVDACKHIDKDLLIVDNRVRATDKGFDYLNEILEQLLPG